VRGIAGQRVDVGLVPVQAERVVAAIGDPEGGVEAGLAFGGAAAQPLGVVVVAEGVGQVGARQLGGVGVTLDLGQRDRRVGAMAVRVVDAVAAVLPALVEPAAIGVPAVFDEAVAVEIAVPVDPGQRRVGGGKQGADDIGVGAPAQCLAEQHDEQRRGVHRAVAGARPVGLARRTVVGARDAPRLLLGVRIGGGAL